MQNLLFDSHTRQETLSYDMHLSEAPNGLYIHTDLQAVLKLKWPFQNAGTLFEYSTNAITIWTTWAFDIPLSINPLKKGGSSVIIIRTELLVKTTCNKLIYHGAPCHTETSLLFFHQVHKKQTLPRCFPQINVCK